MNVDFVNFRVLEFFDGVKTMIEGTNIMEALEYSGIKAEKFELFI